MFLYAQSIFIWIDGVSLHCRLVGCVTALLAILPKHFSSSNPLTHCNILSSLFKEVLIRPRSVELAAPKYSILLPIIIIHVLVLFIVAVLVSCKWWLHDISSSQVVLLWCLYFPFLSAEEMWTESFYSYAFMMDNFLLGCWSVSRVVQ